MDLIKGLAATLIEGVAGKETEQTVQGERSDHIWVSAAKEDDFSRLWKKCEIASVSTDRKEVSVIDEEAKKVVQYRVQETLPFDRSHDGFEDDHDLSRMNYLHQASLLNKLQVRYMNDQIYTNFGDTLISVNPYKEIPSLYHGDQAAEKAHVFTIARNALESLAKKKKSQSIIVCGDSGSGKTVAAKHIMRRLVELSKKGGQVEKLVVESTPILEAFGNSVTTRNDNSSRFGRFNQIKYDSSGSTITGLHTVHYLLEKSRVVARSSGERSFHAFYQACEGLPSLGKPEEYHYLLPVLSPGNFQGDLPDDKAGFKTTCAALSRVGFTKEQQDQIWQVISIVLTLGNVDFVTSKNDPHNTGRCEIAKSSLSALESVAELLQIEDAGVLNNVLCSRTITAGAGGSVTKIDLDVTQARESRDALAKWLFASLFDWLVGEMNDKSMDKKKRGKQRYIGILDIFGFEDLEYNSFEQLCVNFANELLQIQFDTYVMQNEERIFEEEGIASPVIEIPSLLSGHEVINLLQGRVFMLLEEESRIRNGTDTNFLGKLSSKDATHSRLRIDRKVPNAFIVRHFAGQVSYTVTGFVAKNSDTLFPDLKMLMTTVKHLPMVQQSATAPTSAMKETVLKKFSGDMKNLVSALAQTDQRFVRCLKPNLDMTEHEWDVRLALNQLEYLGIVQAADIHQANFPVRRAYDWFSKKYVKLLPEDDASKYPEPQTRSILNNMLGAEAEGTKWVAGRKQVFLGSDVLSQLDGLIREMRLEELANMTDEEREKAEAEERAEKEREIREAEERLRLSEEQRKQQERDRLEKERLERERVEQEERNRRAKLEEERLAKERAEREREAQIEKDRLEKERLELQQLVQLEQERLEQERQQRERVAQEEKERLEKEYQAQQERNRLAKLEQERLEQERLDRERKALAEKERLEKERVELQKLNQQEQERLAKEKLEREKLAQQEAERVEAERVERERLALVEKQKFEEEMAEHGRITALEREKLAQLEKDTVEAERLAKVERERLEELQKENARIEQEGMQRNAELDRQRAEREAAEQEQLAKLEADRMEAMRLVQAERERLAELEKERLERERLEQIRLDKIEQERLEAERIEQERLAEEQRLIEEEAERVRLLEEAEKARIAEEARKKKELAKARKKRRKQKIAIVIKFQALSRGKLVRKRFHDLTSRREIWKHLLKENEAVVLASLMLVRKKSSSLRRFLILTTSKRMILMNPYDETDVEELDYEQDQLTSLGAQELVLWMKKSEEEPKEGDKSNNRLSQRMSRRLSMNRTLSRKTSKANLNKSLNRKSSRNNVMSAGNRKSMNLTGNRKSMNRTGNRKSMNRTASRVGMSSGNKWILQDLLNKAHLWVSMVNSDCSVHQMASLGFEGVLRHTVERSELIVPIYYGILTKRAILGGDNKKKAVRSRFFVLTNESLSWYAYGQNPGPELEENPRGRILFGAHTLFKEPSVKEAGEIKPFVFDVIANPNKQKTAHVRMYAKTSAAFNLWKEHLKATIKYANEHPKELKHSVKVPKSGKMKTSKFTASQFEAGLADMDKATKANARKIVSRKVTRRL